MDIKINIFNEYKGFKIPRKKINKILENLFFTESYIFATINVIFIDDIAIQKLNKKFLEHDYATDVISFCLENEPLECEVYISVDTAIKNSLEYKTKLTDELLRYVIHGALHIIGYDDFSLADREKMRMLEDKYLKIE